MGYTYAGSEFDISGPDDQAVLVYIPEGFELKSANVHQSAVITDGEGNVLKNTMDGHDGGSVVRVVIKRSSVHAQAELV